MRAGLLCLLAACGPVGPREAFDQPAPELGPPRAPFVVVERSGSGSRLVLVDESGARVRPLTSPGSDEVVLDLHPSWSPDGKQVVFASTRGRGRLDRFALWRVAVDQVDAPARPLVPAEGEAIDWFPDWSPDGASIVFASSRGGEFELYRVPAAGGVPEKLLDRPGTQDIEPAYAADGASLAFTAVNEAGAEMFVVELDGGTTVSLGSGRTPSFAPDGRWLVFVDRHQGRGDADVFRVERDGSGRRLLVDDDLGDEAAPRVSADGQWLFASSVVRDQARVGQYSALLVTELASAKPVWRTLRERHPAPRLGADVAWTGLDAAVLRKSPTYPDALAEMLLDSGARQSGDTE